MKTYILTVHTIDEQSRLFSIKAESKKAAVGVFLRKWDHLLLSYTIVSIEEEK